MSKYPQLEGLHGVAYSNAWNKLHRVEGREASKRYRQSEKGKAYRKERLKIDRQMEAYKKRRSRFNKKRNDKSQKFATMRGERWGPVEDAMLFSGIPHSKLVHELGRSIMAIQMRKIRLTKQDK